MGIRANNPHNEYMIALVRCALLGEKVPQLPESCDAAALGQLICRQQLSNLVFNVVAATPQLKPLRMQLERDYMVQIPKITNQDFEIKKWLDAADAKGLDCIPLKGFLLRQLYPTPMMRSMTDLDVLVRNMDRQDVRLWMEGMGYTAEQTHELSHHDNYEKRPWMYMELHMHLMKPRPGRDELEKKIWSRATLLPGYQHIYQMSMEDFYVFHLLHLHKHFMSRGVGLKSVIDIHVFLKAHGASLDREYLNRELDALGIREFGSYMEHLAGVLLGNEPADDNSRLVADYMADCGSFGSNRQYHIIRMAEATGKHGGVGRMRYRLKLVFPGVKEMSKRFPSVSRVPFLLPFYWVANVFRHIFRGKEHQRTVHPISNEQFDAMAHILNVTGASSGK